jgi:methyl-accepting chemotaxis protein
MFPQSFNARVAQRMAIWCAMLGFLVFLYAATAVIQTSRMIEISDDREQATAALLAHVRGGAAFVRIASIAPAARTQAALAGDFDEILAAIDTVASRIGVGEVRTQARETRAAFEALRAALANPQGWDQALAAATDKRLHLGKAITDRLDAINERQAGILASNRQNEILIALLAIFVLGQIAFLEYRWLVKPIVRMAKLLRTGEHSWRDLASDTARRDEIGDFAKALNRHFTLVQQQQQMASHEQAKLSERLARQENLKRESVSFQDRIAEIVQRLEGHAGRMSTASADLVSISTEADARAGASVESTQRVSSHVDAVASSIRHISNTLTAVVDDAERTSAVAAAARALVGAAREDTKALTEAARAIESVIELIEDVANQTNLLALNATIEAARAGEAGRGFGVVAHEVKQLATRTSRATEDVRGGLQGITAASSRIAERVAKLVESIEQVDAVAAAIASSMRSQDANSQAITSSTTKSAGDVRELAATVKEVADIISEARQAADLVTRSSTDLGQQAADLRSAVDRFIETTERIAA